MMNTKSIYKRYYINIIADTIVGLFIIITGIIMNVRGFNADMMDYKRIYKAIIAFSLIPFGSAFSNWVNLHTIKKHPNEMKPAIIAENDERLIAERNKAEANSNRLLIKIIYISFLAYTILVPSDAFKAVGWWILLVIFTFSFILPLINLKLIKRHNK